MKSESAHTTDAVTTVAQLAALPRDNACYELVRGELRVVSPAGGRHGRVAMKLAQLLANHVDALRLGVVYAAETGFILQRDPDTVRAPDVAFVSRARADRIDDDTRFVPLAPDLAVEVISPTDTFSAVEDKTFDWLSAGTRLVLLVDPASRRVHAYRSADNIVVLGENEQLQADDVVDQWRVDVKSLFVN
ncbi:MAG: Uma2 family endonuclease [Pirellulaceae bacterium]|nr:Uma2 family endonuclease [Pirellulaceae bacterium]